jgi:hypothetical protein
MLEGQLVSTTAKYRRKITTIIDKGISMGVSQCTYLLLTAEILIDKSVLSDLSVRAYYLSEPSRLWMFSTLLGRSSANSSSPTFALWQEGGGDQDGDPGDSELRERLTAQLVGEGDEDTQRGELSLVLLCY